MQLHPGKKIQEELKDRGWTQRQFAFLLGKKVSEVNELIKGKRNITVQRDILLSHVLGTSRKYRLDLQNEYDYSQIELEFDFSKLSQIKQDKIAGYQGQKLNKEEKIDKPLDTHTLDKKKLNLTGPKDSKKENKVDIENKFKNIKDKYEKQRIYNSDDKFDICVPIKTDSNLSKTVEIKKSTKNPQIKVTSNQNKALEKSKNKHKDKEHIFRNF